MKRIRGSGRSTVQKQVPQGDLGESAAQRGDSGESKVWSGDILKTNGIILEVFSSCTGQAGC